MSGVTYKDQRRYKCLKNALLCVTSVKQRRHCLVTKAIILYKHVIIREVVDFELIFTKTVSNTHKQKALNAHFHLDARIHSSQFTVRNQQTNDYIATSMSSNANSFVYLHCCQCRNRKKKNLIFYKRCHLFFNIFRGLYLQVVQMEVYVNEWRQAPIDYEQFYGIYLKTICWQIQLTPLNKATKGPVDFKYRCQAKFLTSAKFLTYYCLSVILLLRVNE